MVSSVSVAVRGALAPARIRAFRHLWAAQVVTELGDWSARLALGILVYTQTGSPTLTAVVEAVSLAPWLGPGQVLATLADRWPRRRIMICSDLVRAAAFTVAALPVPLWLLLTVVFIAGLATPPFSAARSAIRPEIVPADMLGPAVTLAGITEDSSLVAGYLLAGGLVAIVGAQGALLVNAASFVLSALLLARGVPAVTHTTGAMKKRLRQAGTALLSDRPVRRAIAMVTVCAGAFAAVLSLVAPFALQTLHSGASWAAALAATAGLTSLVVSLGAPPPEQVPALLRRSALLSVGAGAVAAVLFAFAPTLAGGLLAFAALGVLMVVVLCGNVLVAPRLPPPLRASAFSLLMGTLAASQALGSVVTGLLASVFGISAACALICLPPALLGGWFLLSPLPAELPGASDADLPIDTVMGTPAPVPA